MATQAVKDILNTEGPSPAYSLLPKYGGTVPSESSLSRNGEDGAATTLTPGGEIIEVSEDEPRFWGTQQGLLLEPSSTNRVPYSADFSKWDNTANTYGAYNVVPSGIPKNVTSGFMTQGAGNFSGGIETLSMIVEADATNRSQGFRLMAQDQNNFTAVGRCVFDMSTPEILSTIGIEANFNKILREGPNDGGAVYRLSVTYDSSGYGEESMQVRFDSDINSSGDVAVHHAQIEERATETSPILTGSSAKTRAKDFFYFFEGGQPEWWQPQVGMTVIFEGQLLSHRSNGAYWLNFDGQGIMRSGWGGGDLNYPVTFDFDDSSGPIGGENTGGVYGYETQKIGVTFDRNQIEIYREGPRSDGTGSKSYNGSWLDAGSLLIGRQSSPLLITKANWIPGTLPLTRADRSTGDPVSLETLNA